MKINDQSSLFMAFVRIGLLGFGGGPAMIPLVHQEAVKRYRWLEEEEFADILAIANTLPGPIATKMPGYIGYRVGGIVGCINAVTAVTLPMILAMILLLGLFSRYRSVEWIHGMSQAVIPVVMVMMVQLTWDFWSRSRGALGWFISLAMIVLAGGLIYWLGVHPALVVGALLFTALAIPVATSSKTEATQ
jgi:chromate transporter